MSSPSVPPSVSVTGAIVAGSISDSRNSVGVGLSRASLDWMWLMYVLNSLKPGAVRSIGNREMGSCAIVLWPPEKCRSVCWPETLTSSNIGTFFVDWTLFDPLLRTEKSELELGGVVGVVNVVCLWATVVVKEYEL